MIIMPFPTRSDGISGRKATVETRKLKIGISVWSFTPNTGGLQAHAQLLCHYLKLRGHDVTVITRSATRIPKAGDYLFANEPPNPISVHGIPVSPLRISKMWKPVLWTILKTAARKQTAPMAARLYEMISARPARNAFSGYDLIHHIGHATALMGFASSQAADFHGVPFLVQPTAHPYIFGDSALDFRLYRKADRLLVHTRYEHTFFRAKGINCPIDVVGNGIEDRSDGQSGRFQSKYAIKGPIILYLGRKTADKGYLLMIEAFNLLRIRNPTAILVCMGPASSETKVKQVTGVLQFDYVTEDEKHDALAACTCLCVPSEGESFGLVYMEAGRYRKPVIGRNLPVLRELLGNKQAALLLGDSDDGKNTVKLEAAELAEGISKLINNPAFARNIGEACRRVSDSFLWPNVVQRFETAYLKAIESHRPVNWKNYPVLTW